MLRIHIMLMLLPIVVGCRVSTISEGAKIDNLAPVLSSDLKQRINKQETLSQIADLQNIRASQELVAFLQNPDVDIRAKAALAFASIQQPEDLPLLTKQLRSEPAPDVREKLAFAIGQLRDPQSFDVLKSIYEQEKADIVKVALLEAMGKCANAGGLDYIVNIPITDPYLRYGQMLGIHRAALSGQLSEAATNKAIELLHINNTDQVRELSAAYLARFQSNIQVIHAIPLLNSVQYDPNPYVRLFSAQAASSISDQYVLDVFKKMLMKEVHPQVLSSLIQSMQRFDYRAHKDLIAHFLNHSEPNVAQAAAQYFRAKAEAADRKNYLEWAKQAQYPEAKAHLLAASLKWQADEEAKRFAVASLESAMPVYAKKLMLMAMSQSSALLPVISRYTAPNYPLVLRSGAMEAIAALCGQAGFQEQVLSHADTRQLLNAQLEAALQSGDVGILYFAAQILMEEGIRAKTWFGQVGLIQAAKAQLKMPEDLEGIMELEKAAAYFEGRPAVTPSVARYEPIDHQLLASLPENALVRIQTSKGVVMMRLLPQDAPSTVSLFVKLVKEGFYFGKTFHRVVPNFVAQGGCPRGDGFGSLPVMVRSEFSLTRYQHPGFVGVASAGKDTESCQWFINTVPTPHLDGRYTIFAQVVEGMEVVQKWQIGDSIERVDLL